MSVWLRPWPPPKCPSCGVRPIAAEVLVGSEEAPTSLGVFCQPCGIIVLHRESERQAKAEREARWHKPDFRGV